MEHAIAENVLAGNAMARRAQYQFGGLLPAGPEAAVGAGLGKTLSKGSMGLIAPTDYIKKSGQEMTVDGIKIQFRMANETEAPSEFYFYFPEMKALCLSEVATATMHNIYTLRGAKARDALNWSRYINEMSDAFPDAQVAFRSHHWPIWEAANIQKYLKNQRDAYRFIHDRALYLANSGKTLNDIGSEAFFPKGLASDFSTHGYYGTLSHNLRGVTNYYLGYYDSNPATLNRLPVTQSAQKYVAAMGGAKKVLKLATDAYNKGEYRWAAELNNNLVYAEPTNQSAKSLQANILEQLGYQSESGVWRNQYLSGAKELREGTVPSQLSAQNPDLIKAMSTDLIFDSLAVRLDHQKVDGQEIGVNIHFSDSNEDYALELSNSVLNNTKGRVLPNAQASITMTKPAMFKMLLGKVPLPELVKNGEAKFSGDPKALAVIFGNLTSFSSNFPLVTPE